MTEVARALTVRQPWAHALAHGPKDGENRSRRIFTPPAEGVWVALHTGKAGSSHADRFEVQAWWPQYRWWREICGAVIAVVRFLPPHPPHTGSTSPWRDPGQWWYPRAEVIPLREPVPAKGALGLWTMPPDVADAVRAQLMEVTP